MPHLCPRLLSLALLCPLLLCHPRATAVCGLQGGSVTPEAAVVLSELRNKALLEVHEHSEVLDAAWDWEAERWDVWLQVGRHNASG